MVEKGLCLKTRDYLGRTPLLNFLSDGGSRADHFVKELLKLGANVKARDYEGKSVLHHLATAELSFWDGGREDLECKTRFMQ